MTAFSHADPLPASALEECAREPIHIPGGVQSFGVLLALDDQFVIRQCGGLVATHFGSRNEDLLGRTLAQVFGADIEQAIRGIADGLSPGVVRDLGEVPSPAVPSTRLAVLAHRHDGVLILELIESGIPLHVPGSLGDTANTAHTLAGILDESASALSTGRSVQALLQQLVERVRDLSGYDRVMAYQFDQEDNGEVLAEAKRSDMEPFLGLHYPAADIPPQARRLYLTTRVRVLADAAADSSPLVPRLNPHTGRELDLSHALLRALSPIHREYLGNMGVRASLVVSLVALGRLWGLLVCHHLSPRLPSATARAVVAGLSALAGAEIELFVMAERTRGAAAARAALESLPAALERHPDWATGLIAAKPGLMELLGASGIAVIDGGKIVSRGLTPGRDDLLLLAEWLDSQGRPLVRTDRLGIDEPRFAALSEVAAGLLALRATQVSRGWVLWFRPERGRQVFWAGDPRKGLMTASEPQGQALRLTPRKSFERWLEEVRGCAEPWSEADLAATAEVVRPNLMEVLAAWHSRRAAELQRYHTILFERVSDAVVVTDLSGRVTFWNTGAVRLFGWSAAEVLGRPLGDRLPEAKRAELTRRFGRGAVSSEGLSGDWSYRLENGSTVWIDTRVELVCGEDGRPLGTVSISRDVTAARAAADDLRRAKDAAEAANRVKGQFLANMSHEIRTPMNGILGLTNLVLDTDLSPDQRESLQLVKSSGDALLTILNDILDLSRIEAGRLDLDPAPFSLPEEVGNALRVLTPQAHAKGLELVCDIRPDVPEWVVGDSHRLRQVLTNLVGNAIKFTHQGEVVVQIRPVAGGNLRFEVSDTGIGIAADKLQIVFEPFTQADGTTTRHYGGTGLGLTICQRLVGLMGGRVQVSSELGKGATFYFEIRMEPARGPLLEVAPSGGRVPLYSSSAGTSQPGVDLTGLAVLVVDDNATARRVVADLLRAWQAVPLCAASGAEALSELQRLAGNGLPSPLLLLDATMPEMDGIRVAEQIVRESPMARTRIVMLTSGSSPGDLARCRDVGVVGFVAKPVKGADLKRAIGAALSLATGPVLRVPSQAVSSTDNPDARSASRGLRVLVAEDNLVNQRVVLRMLEKAGHIVTLTGTGVEALAALDRADFDVVLMDVQMPAMDGLTATRLIREREAGKERRQYVVAMTAHAMNEDRELCLASGMDDYVRKPLQATELERVLKIQPTRRAAPCPIPLPVAP